MHLSEVNTMFEHRITEGSDYLWGCWDNARFIEYESEYAYVSAVFNTVNQMVYQIEISCKAEMFENEPSPYRWLNPSTKDLFIDESMKHNVDPNIAWDDVVWVDLETKEDFFEKATAIFNGRDFDARISVPIELEDDLLLQLCLKAHAKDITLNKMVEEILISMIDSKSTRVAIN